MHRHPWAGPDAGGVATLALFALLGSSLIALNGRVGRSAFLVAALAPVVATVVTATVRRSPPHR